jgi:hypothetical protein
MALPPSRDHKITLADARTLLQRHRTAVAQGAERGGMFHAKAVRDLLAQPGVVGLRYYHGRKADGSAATVLVGVDANGNDMSSGTVLEEHYPCPPFCPDPDGLNP